MPPQDRTRTAHAQIVSQFGPALRRVVNPNGPPMIGPRIRPLLVGFTAAMSLAALAFWIAALVAGGPRAVIAGIDMTLMVLFAIAHLPAMAAATELWRDGAFQGRAVLRAGLLASAVYFSAACVIAVLGNALAASILGMLDR